MTGFVYFIKPIGMPGPIKIGYSKQSESRLAGLLVSSPLPLEIIAKIPGTTTVERTLHACFADTHSHCEWFRPSARLVAAVDAIRRGVPVDEAVDLAKATGVIKVEYAAKSPERSDFLRFRRAISLAMANANRQLGDAPHIRCPDDAAVVIAEWQRQLRFHPWRPDDAALTRLAHVVADPLLHGVSIVAPAEPTRSAA